MGYSTTVIVCRLSIGLGLLEENGPEGRLFLLFFFVCRLFCFPCHIMFGKEFEIRLYQFLVLVCSLTLSNSLQKMGFVFLSNRITRLLLQFNILPKHTLCISKMTKSKTNIDEASQGRQRSQSC